MLRRQWQSDEPSYLRTYLDNGLWGKDALWDGLVRNAFTLFLCLYMLPPRYGRAPADSTCASTTTCPRSGFFEHYLPGDARA